MTIAQKNIKIIKKEHRKITNYFLKEQESEFGAIGLYNGVSGRCLLMAENYLVSNNEIYKDKIQHYLDYSIEIIVKGKNINHSFSSGIAGWCWTIQYLHKKK